MAVKRQSEAIEKHIAGREVDRLEAVLRVMNSEDQSEQMTGLIESTTLIDPTCQTDFYQIFPELTRYWISSQIGTSS